MLSEREEKADEEVVRDVIILSDSEYWDMNIIYRS